MGDIPHGQFWILNDFEYCDEPSYFGPQGGKPCDSNSRYGDFSDLNNKEDSYAAKMGIEPAQNGR